MRRFPTGGRHDISKQLQKNISMTNVDNFERSDNFYNSLTPKKLSTCETLEQLHLMNTSMTIRNGQPSEDAWERGSTH